MVQSRRPLRKLFVLLAGLWFFALLAAAQATNQDNRPNFVIILADDMGYGDVGVFGSPSIRTPNLDRMAYEGLKLTQFYTVNSICSPSRSSLLTGRHPVRNGVYTPAHWPDDMFLRVFLPYSTGGLPKTETTVAKVLQNNGYQTALIGKWHLGHYGGVLPTQAHGFDYWYGLPYSQDEGCPVSRTGDFECDGRVKEVGFPGTPLYRNNDIIQQPVDLPTLTQQYNTEIMGFLDRAANASKPFFLYIAHDQVHVQLYASQNFLGKSRRGLYGDAAEEMDDSVGQVLAKLKSLGIDKNTMVFFTSDNGPWLEQHLEGGSAGPFRGGKGSTWEGGLREPAIFWWPGKIAPGQTSLEVATNADIFPTLLQLANVPLPTNITLDGTSLNPLLFQDAPVHTNELIGFWRDDMLYAARWNQYKIHFYTRTGFEPDPPASHNPPLLFNVEWDPHEKFPLNVTQYAQVLQTMINLSNQHKKEMVFGVPQLTWTLSTDPFASPCCNSIWPVNCTC